MIIKADKQFSESDYKSLFEFSMEEESTDRAQRGDEFNVEEEQNKAVFRKKDRYTYKDLIDFYEKKRFTLSFIVYRAVSFWPLFDAIAMYGHVLSNLLIVWSAIALSVSFYNAFNFLCVCLFYLLTA